MSAAAVVRSLPHLLATALVGVGVLLAALPLAGLSPAQAHVAGLVTASLGLWATGVIPEALTALAFFTVAMLAGLAPAEVVFSGLASSAFWLVFAGLVIGAAIRSTGLAARIAFVTARSIGATWTGAVVGVVAIGLVMAVLMPSSMGRVVLMLPILDALADHLGHPRGGRGHLGLVAAGVFGTVAPAFAILPANIPNVVLAGLVETSFGMSLSYGHYLLLHFPVLGLVKAVVLVGLLLALYPGDGHCPLDETAEAPGPMSRAELRLVLVLAGALALWTTDSLHHISPAWVGMSAAIVCLLPPVGILPVTAMRQINLEPALYVGGIVSLGALITHVGLGQALADWALHVAHIAPGTPAADFAQLSGSATLLGTVVTLPGVPAVLTPLAREFASAAGLPLDAVLATQVVGFSTFFLPFQSPPLIMAIQIGEIPRRDVTRLCLAMAAVSLLALWPLDYLWLRLLGLFGG